MKSSISQHQNLEIDSEITCALSFKLLHFSIYCSYNVIYIHNYHIYIVLQYDRKSQ